MAEGAGRDAAASGLTSIVEFVLELDKLKGVTRKTRPLGLERYENSAEHSWQLALFAASHQTSYPSNAETVRRSPEQTKTDFASHIP